MTVAGVLDAESIRRIAVLRALPGLGDLLCTMPALRALRRGFPEAHVTLIGLPVARDVVARFPSYVDELQPFPGWPGVTEVPLEPARTAAFLQRAQAEPADLALQLHGSGQATNPFVALLGATRSAGFFLPGFWSPDPELFFPYPAEQPEPLRHLELMRRLGLPAEDAGLEFPLREHDERDGRRLAERHRLLDRPYACLNPGASVPRRRWPAERFAAVADGLSRRGLIPVLVGAPGEEELSARVAAAMRERAVDLAGLTTLGALAWLLSHAAVTVTNDTGTSHLAAAMRAPSVVIFTASDPARWAPLDRDRHRALGTADAGPAGDDACTRCLRDGCRRLGDPAVSDVLPADVLAECDALVTRVAATAPGAAASSGVHASSTG